MDDFTNDSIMFRVLCDDKKEEQSKAIIRIELEHMEKLGIKNGDIVKVSGNNKSTAAICLPMDKNPDDTAQIAKPQDMEIEFLNNPHKKFLLPKIILSNLVSCNIDPTVGWNQLVKISKFSQKQGQLESIPEATVVTLGTIEMTDKAMPGYKNNLDYSELMDRIMVKNDRIDIAFQKDWLAKKQQTMDKTQEFPISSSFQFIIVDVKPKGNEFWKITPNTKFEFQDMDPGLMFDPFTFKPKHLVDVIPIAKQLSVGDTEFTIPSIEVYDNLMKIIWYSHQRVKLPEFADIQKIDAMIRSHMHDMPKLVITMTDDLGNLYTKIQEGGGGGTSGPDPAENEMIADFSFYYLFKPTLDPRAKEITVTIQEIHWLKNGEIIHDMNISPQNMTKTDSASNKEKTGIEDPAFKPNSYFMTPIERSPRKLVIAEGPWEFKIPLN